MDDKKDEKLVQELRKEISREKPPKIMSSMLKNNKEELLQDHHTIKEAFIIEKLKLYMQFEEPQKASWNEEVQLRLQKKSDWKRQLEQDWEETISEVEQQGGFCGCTEEAIRTIKQKLFEKMGVGEDNE